MTSPLPFYTIGHSNRSAAAFIALLKQCGVVVLVDIRTVPRSRANPQFNGDALGPNLAAEGITYLYMRDLGGLRGKSRVLPAASNAYWDNQSFHNYADYAVTPEFHDGLRQLIEIGHRQRCAIMCAEAVWWRCHRRIVSDYLIANGEIVLHIMGEGQVKPATLTPGAVIQRDRTILYPAST